MWIKNQLKNSFVVNSITQFRIRSMCVLFAVVFFFYVLELPLFKPQLIRKSVSKATSGTAGTLPNIIPMIIPVMTQNGFGCTAQTKDLLL